MKKPTAAVFLLFIFLLAGCSNQDLEAKIEQLTEENERLENENELLQLEVTELEQQMANHQNKIISLENNLQSKSSMISRLNDNLESYYKNSREQENAYLGAFQNISSEIGSDMLAESLGIFDPDKVAVGDRVGDFTVSSVEREVGEVSTKYFIDFDGEFVLEGQIMPSQVSSGYVFIFNPEDLKELPRTFREIARERNSFRIQNPDELEAVLGGRLEDLNQNTLQLKAVFSHYSYNFVPETDATNTAKFEKIQ